MSRLWIRDLNVGQNVQLEVCILRGEVLKTRNGDDYLALTLSDCTDKIAAKRWKPSTVECETVATVRFARVWGKVDKYEEKPQLVLSRPLQDIGMPADLTDFHRSSPLPLAVLKARLHDHIASVRDPRMHALLEAVFVEDTMFSAAFLEYPAALDNHHAFRNGLLHHTLEVTDVVAATADKQQHWGGKPLHRDLAITGALLHDIGKIEEMRQENFIYEFSDAGSLLGHITLGTIYLARKIAHVRHKKGVGFPAELEQMILHLVSSHHGKGEWGSPKAPMTPEAIVLHMADKTSADLYFIQEARSEADGSKRFVRQRKLDSGFGGVGRFVFVGDMEALRLPDAEVRPVAEPESYPIPKEFRLPVLRLVETAEDESDAHIVTRSLPLYGKIAAGQPLLHSANQEGELRVDVTALGSGRSNYYLLRVQGDSMAGDGIQDGDLIVVRHQEYADYGDLIVALLEDEGATVKRLVREKDRVFLMPSNPMHAPIPVPDPTQLQVQGRVVGIARFADA